MNTDKLFKDRIVGNSKVNKTPDLPIKSEYVFTPKKTTLVYTFKNGDKIADADVPAERLTGR